MLPISSSTGSNACDEEGSSVDDSAFRRRDSSECRMLCLSSSVRVKCNWPQEMRHVMTRSAKKVQQLKKKKKK